MFCSILIYLIFLIYLKSITTIVFTAFRSFSYKHQQRYFRLSGTLFSPGSENKNNHCEKFCYIFSKKSFSYISGNETFYPRPQKAKHALYSSKSVLSTFWGDCRFCEHSKLFNAKRKISKFSLASYTYPRTSPIHYSLHQNIPYQNCQKKYSYHQ